MANTQHVTSNRLTEESNALQANSRKNVLLFGLPIVVVALLYHVIFGVVALIVTAFIYFNQKGSTVIEAGAKGEDIALNLLEELPDSFTIFNQLDIPNQRSRTGFTEADIVVSGPTAIFVIEVKHNHGEIECDELNSQWTVTKTGRGGTRYDKEMRNPIKQVKTQVWLLAEHLKYKKANAWVQPVVLFTNPEAELFSDSVPSIPVLTSAEIVDYIAKFEPQSPKPVRKITIKAIVALKG